MGLLSFQAPSRRALAWIAGIVAAALAVRAGLGPFRIPGVDVVVNSPFRLETIFWLAVLALLLMLRPIQGAAGEANNIFPRGYLAAMLCMVALAFSRNLPDPFLSDDYSLLTTVGPFTWKALAHYVLSAGGDGSWRPLGYAYYAIFRNLAGVSSMKWHAVGLALHLANCALVFRVAWKLWRNTAAAVLAAAAFGLNGTRPEAALWTAGNYDLLAALCILAAMNVALSDRINPIAALLMTALLTATGLMFKESAYAAPFLLAAVSMKRQSGRRLVVASVLVCAFFFGWRWHVFGGLGGYNDPATGKSLLLSLHAATTAKALLGRIWTIFLVPLNWDAPARWWLPASVLASTLSLIVLLTSRRADPAPSRARQLALMGALIGAALPAIHLALVSQSMLGSRILYLPGVAFALLLGTTAVGAGKRGALAAAVMVLGTAGILENNLCAWHDASFRARELCARGAAGAPVAPVETYEGVYFFRNGFAECVAQARTGDRPAN